MNKTDIERIRAQIRRTLGEAEELVEDSDTIGEADAVAPSVNSGSLTLPEHQLTEMSRTVSVSETIGTPQL